MPKGAGLSTTARGLGYAHQMLRRRLLPLAWGTPCPLCGQLMLQGQQLDLDHEIPRAFGLAASERGAKRMAHRRCNRVRGSQLGHRRRAAMSGGAVRRAQIRSRVW